MGLTVVVIENLPAPDRRGAAVPAVAAPEVPEPVELLDGDQLVLRLGGVGGRREPRSQSPATPAASAEVAPRPASRQTDDPSDFHVVQPGDTLSQIAERYLGSAQRADELARLNGLGDPSALRVGQVLKLR